MYVEGVGGLLGRRGASCLIFVIIPWETRERGLRWSMPVFYVLRSKANRRWAWDFAVTQGVSSGAPGLHIAGMAGVVDVVISAIRMGRHSVVGG